MNQHEGNDNDYLDYIPQYVFEGQNENIREVYITNRNHIQADHQAGDIRQTYNFPVNNLNGRIEKSEGKLTKYMMINQQLFE